MPKFLIPPDEVLSMVISPPALLLNVSCVRIPNPPIPTLAPTWIMDPLSNMLLILDKYGKYLLDKQEKLSGQVFFALLATSLLMLIGYLITGIDYFTIICLTLLATILPFTKGILANKKTSKVINIAYGAIMLSIAIFGSISGFPISSFGLIIGAMFIAYTWFGSLISK